MAAKNKEDLFCLLEPFFLISLKNFITEKKIPKFTTASAIGIKMLAIEVLLVNSVPIIANKMIITRADSLAFGTTSPRTSPISFDSPDF